MSFRSATRRIRSVKFADAGEPVSRRFRSVQVLCERAVLLVFGVWAQVKGDCGP